LTARDYALLDLHVRHGLHAAEIAYVLGVTRKEAQTILARMTHSGTGVIETYVLARRGACPDLRAALTPFGIPPLEDAARDAAQAHIAVCNACQQERRKLPPVLGVLGAFAPVLPSLALKGDLWQKTAATWRIAPASVEAALFEDEPFDDPGDSPYKPLSDPMTGGAPPFYPRPPVRPDAAGEWSGNKVLVFAVAAVGLLVFAFAGGAVIAGAFDGGGDDGGSAAADSTPPGAPGVDVTPGSGVPGVVVETPTQDPRRTATSTPTEEPTETPPPAATATRPPAASPTPPPAPATATPGAGVSPTPTRRAVIPIGTPTPNQ
jgi:hypothetical protein